MYVEFRQAALHASAHPLAVFEIFPAVEFVA
jgi:hypothetical protein